MITKEEYGLLKYYHTTGYRWIARDENEELCVYETRPIKLTCSWLNFNIHERFDTVCDDDHLFQYIKWDDEEPTKILDLMQDYESHQIITGKNMLNDFFGTDNFNIKYVPQFKNLLYSLKKDVEKEKLYTVKLANGDCLYKFKDIEVGWTNGYSNYKNDKDFQLTQSEIESVDPVLMQIAEEVQ